MFCGNCGSEINNEAVVCVHCGTVLNSSVLHFQPAADYVPAEKNRNGCAIAGFILSFFGVIGWLFSVLGLIFSIIGLVKSKELKTGKGYGVAGIVISVCTFFVHGFIMMIIMPYLVRLIAAPVFLLILLLCGV